MNLSISAKRNSSNQTNMSAKQSPAVEGLGLSGWLSSWLPTGGLAPVQATKKTASNPNKGMNMHHPSPGYYLAMIVYRFAS